MNTLDKKIDATVVFSVKNANPNGDPLTGNRPRETMEGYGEVSPQCIKRKGRNRMQDLGANIFVQSRDRSDDGCNSLSERAATLIKGNGKGKFKFIEEAEDFKAKACEKWFDVRTFGQVFAYSGWSNAGIRGPVSIHPAYTVHPISINSMSITKSVNGDPTSDGGPSSDTMGMMHRVDFGVYMFHVSINPQLAEKTGFNYEDAKTLKKALETLFENDASNARPEGSMEVVNVFWWEHNSKLGQHPSAKVHRAVTVEALTDDPKSMKDIKITYRELDGLAPEVFNGREDISAELIQA